jgi:formate dehydrogenase maturation protein FdhE
VKPGLDLNHYSSVLVEKPQFYPKPTPTDQVSQKSLNDISDYLQQAMQRELAGRLRIVTQPDADTLVLRSAITAVDVSAEGLKFYEVIPIALVLAAANTAAGTRDESTDIYVEMQALDGATSKPVAEIVRKGTGLSLENDSTQLTVKDLKPVLDVWAKDARNFKP